MNSPKTTGAYTPSSSQPSPQSCEDDRAGWKCRGGTTSRRPSGTTSPPRWFHRFAVLLAGATLFLIFVGGLVTSTDSGLAVPDWPLSYGRFMPPMVGGILYEHGHRLVAASVGFLTVLFAVLAAWKEPRSWVKRAAWAAVGLVILQGVLGGVTVLFLLPKPVSILHACLAQTFLCLVVALAVWTSSGWNSSSSIHYGNGKAATLPLHVKSSMLLGALYAQLIFGAVLRHTGWGLPLHVAGAGLSFAISLWILVHLRLQHPGEKKFLGIAWAIPAVLLFQIVLGASTYRLLVHDFDVVPTPFPAIMVITAHVAFGAVLLGLAVLLALLTYRARPASVPSPHPKSFHARLSDYFVLTKPGISFMTGATALAGFVLGSPGRLDVDRLVHTFIGTLLVSAGAGALNMLLEIDVDSRMHRTENRPLPAGRLYPGEALFVGSFLAVLGILYLAWSVNFLTAFLAGLTLSVYLYLYTPLKKVTVLCTSIGAVAGALPPVMGCTAASGRLGAEAWGLFAILFFWQFPHFLALAWLYREDYARAKLFMLPVVEPDGESTARKMVMSGFALWVASLFPALMGLTGRFYVVTALTLGLMFQVTTLLFFKHRSLLWARRVFLASVVYIPLLVTALVVNKTPPFRHQAGGRAPFPQRSKDVGAPEARGLRQEMVAARQRGNRQIAVPSGFTGFRQETSRAHTSSDRSSGEGRFAQAPMR